MKKIFLAMTALIIAAGLNAQSVSNDKNADGILQNNPSTTQKQVVDKKQYSKRNKKLSKKTNEKDMFLVNDSTINKRKTKQKPQ